MAYELTQEEAAEGRHLLRQAVGDPESFFKWAEDKLVIDQDVFKKTLGKCIRAGDHGRAEKFLNVVIENQTNEQLWKDARAGTIRAVWRVMVFLGVVGGMVYLLREIFR